MLCRDECELKASNGNGHEPTCSCRLPSIFCHPCNRSLWLLDGKVNVCHQIQNLINHLVNIKFFFFFFFFFWHGIWSGWHFAYDLDRINFEFDIYRACVTPCMSSTNPQWKYGFLIVTCLCSESNNQEFKKIHFLV